MISVFSVCADQYNLWKSLLKQRRYCQPSSEKTYWKKLGNYRRLPYPPNNYQFQITRINDKSCRKNQKQDYYSGRLKDEITVFPTTVTGLIYTLTCPRPDWKTLMILMQPIIIWLFALVVNIFQSWVNPHES